MIDVQGLSKSFGQKVIYKEVDLTFEAGKSYALVGESGSGKTTLLNIIGRLEKADSGEVLLDKQDIWKIKEADFFRKRLGYIFQNYALIDEASVEENLKLVSKNKNELLAVLAKVGLSKSYLKSKIFELSGGEAQRVAVARLILKKATLILADEPTGALDERTGEVIISLLLGMVRPETTLIIATHDPSVFRRVNKVINIADL